ncbi:MAG TPA: hypothetical protein VGD71_22300 [Kribbella sp.]|jgi:hypothetical protein
MAPTPEPQPDHFLLRGLDEVFTGGGGNAPALAGWLSYLTHPDQHEGPRRMSLWQGIAEIPDSVKEFKRKPGALEQQGGAHFEEQGSILRDLEGSRFFAHAQVLSGQRLGNRNAVGEPEGDLVGDMYRMIETVRYRAPRTGEGGLQDSVAVWHGIREKGNRLFPADPNAVPGWEGDAAAAARPRYDELTLWYERYRDNALAEMMGHLGRFAAVVYTARSELNELMGKLVKALEEWATAEPVNVGFLLGVFGDILGFSLNPGIAAGVTTFYSLVSKVVEGVTKDEPSEFGYEENPEDGCYKLLGSFLTAGDQVLRRAVWAVDDLVTHDEHGVDSVRGGNWAPVPSWG